MLCEIRFNDNIAKFGAGFDIAVCACHVVDDSTCTQLFLFLYTYCLFIKGRAIEQKPHFMYCTVILFKNISMAVTPWKNFRNDFTSELNLES